MTDPDVGASGERTALAWQRTALSVVVAAAVVARLTWPALGPLSIAVPGFAFVLACWVLLVTRQRAHLRDADDPQRTVVAPTALALTIGVVFVCLTEAFALFQRT